MPVALPSLLLFALCARAEVVDRVVVSVEEQLITESEIRLEQVISALDRSPSPFWDREHGTPLERLVEAAIVRELAGDLALYQPTDDAVRERVEAMRGHFPDRGGWQAFLDSWGLSEDDLRALVRRRMVVERYLDRAIQVRGDREAWWAASEEMLARQAARFRIRSIPAREAE